MIRMSLILSCLMALNIVVTASSVSALAPQTSYIDGIVIDESAAAVPNAEVSVTAPSISLKTATDSSGHFRLDLVRQEILSLTVTAKGFEHFERNLNPANEDTTRLRIVLIPASISEQVTVTAARTETRIGETAASVAVLNSEDLNATAAITIDDALRQVPGFSLFRRSGSRTANPTSQGVSLRGLGASGASRALVLADGVPLNDPFGGWIYWSRIPRESVAQVEVLRGGASHLYGGSAIGGVINVLTKHSGARALSFEGSYGNQATSDASVYLSETKDQWSASLGAEVFRTQGYVLVAANESGAVDTPAGSRHAVVDLKLERRFAEGRKLFGSAAFFGESRANGTPLQTNRTHIRQFTFGGDWQTKAAGLFAIRTYGGTEVFDQNFSAVSANRNAETLTRVQRTPAQVVGFSTQWSRALGAQQTLVAGIEAREVRGASDEIVFANGTANSLVGAGGRERSGAIYLEDLIRIGARLFINAGARVDRWRNYAALATTSPLSPGNATVNPFPSRSESAFSPQLSVLFKLTDHVALMGSAARSFRAPTLNELYRSFRVGNVLTLANEQLLAERLTGGEVGSRVSTLDEKLVLRATAFWNDITRPVANVTLRTTPALITRQRQNLGSTRARGVEVDTDLRLRRYWNLSANYLFADATVTRFPANIALEGLMIPQVARHQFTFQARYTNPSTTTIGVQGRAASSQFDDDQNLFRLAGYFTLDAFVSRRIFHGLEGFLALENVLNQRYEIGKTPVTTLGPPILIRAGVRFHLGAR